MSNKKIVFLRVDFSRKKYLSFGHLFRIYKIIDLLPKNKFSFFIITKSNKFNSKFLKPNIRFIKISNDKKNFYKNTFKKHNPDFLIVDLPYNEFNFKKISKNKTKIIVIDDHLKNFSIADYYINPNLLHNKDIKLIKQKQKKYKFKIFTGLNYFVNYHNYYGEKLFNVRKKIYNILINFGGSDPLNLTNKLIKKIYLHNNYSNLNFHFLFGPGFPRKNQKRIKKKNFFYYQNLSQKMLDQLKFMCDLALTSGGNIMLENLKIGLPNLCIGTSPNEIKNIKILSKDNFVYKITLKTVPNVLLNINSLFTFKYRKKINNKLKIIFKKNYFSSLINQILNQIF